MSLQLGNKNDYDIVLDHTYAPCLLSLKEANNRHMYDANVITLENFYFYFKTARKLTYQQNLRESITLS